jgi:5-methylcytosine-specific restriction endonuclease McrA
MEDGRSKRKIDVPKRYCKVCKKEIIRNTTKGTNRISPSTYKNRLFCSIKCKSIWLKDNLKGNKNPNFRGGKSLCDDCGKELAGRYIYRKTKLNKFYCRNCWAKHYRQENSCRWQGGKTEINLLERNRAEAYSWRKLVFERDDYTCQKCGDNTGHNLNAHHIKPWAKYKNLRFNIENGITLCKKCHIEIHKKYAI